jgi:hypothetical protein
MRPADREEDFVRPNPVTPCVAALTVLALAAAPLAAAETYVCGQSDLLFGCTRTEETGRLRAGCGVHAGGRFFTSEWRTYDLATDQMIAAVPTGDDGIALLDVPERRWFVIEGELRCTDGTGGRTIPYRFLVERTGAQAFRPYHYTPESLVATGNWNADTQLHYGAFRSRVITGAAAGGAEPAPAAQPK